jgi:outer membrane protein
MRPVVTVTLLAVLAGAVPAWAAERPAIGYVDLRKVMTESKTGQRNKAELEKLVKERQAALQQEEQKLQALQQELQKNLVLMTDAQKQEKQKDFDGKVEAYKKLRAEAQQTVGKKDNELSNKAIAEIKAIVAELAKEEKLALVLELAEPNVLYAEEGLSLTAKVIQRYDGKQK